jgi:hypothetical protein
LSETVGRSKESPSFRLFAELKRGDRACDELLFVGLQNIGKAALNATPVQRVMFEVIQPDLKISKIHTATLPFASHRV